MTVTIADTLRKLADRVPKGDARKPLSGPWRIDVNGDEWAVASDGRAMLWARPWRPMPFDYCAEDRTRKKLLSLFDAPPGLAVGTHALRDLTEFCGVAAWTEPCPACKGLAKESEYVHCTFCDGDGTMQPDAVPGFLCGAPIDRNRLACVLAPLAGNPMVSVRIGKDSAGTDAYLRLDDGDWRIVLAVMTPDPTPPLDDDEIAKAAAWRDAPKYPPAAADIGRLVEAMAERLGESSGEPR